MMRSMFAAIAGLRNHQAFMDVIGNNIANVNTTAFKAARVTFQDILSQTLKSASGPQGGRGGVNPVQVGLGMTLAGIDTVQTQGNIQSTNRLTDMAIQGDGFFVLNDGAQNFYTRDGAFDIASDGTLVNPASGMKVQGWQAVNGIVDTTAPIGEITIPVGQGMVGQASKALGVKGNLNASQPSFGAITQSNTSGGMGAASGTFTGATATDYVIRIASTNAATGEVTSIQVSTDGGTTFGGAIATSGGTAVGIGNGLSFSVATKTTNGVGDTYRFTTTLPKVTTSTTVYDSLGIAHAIQLTFTKTGTSNTWTWLANSTEAGVTITPNTATNLTFSTAGNYVGGQPAGTLSVTLPNGAATPLQVNLDLSGLTQLASTSDVASTSDGAAAGSLSTFAVTATGEITGIYSNGLKRSLGQIAVASFANPGGLMKSGSNLFEASPNSGTAAVGIAGAGGRGEISTGYLEMSNVDLAQQFTNMIMSERGFQANARVITASDEILQDLVNLKR